MTSSRPYLIRAIHAWIVDNGLTPQVLVNAGEEGVRVPERHVKEGKILLNISPQATQGLQLGNAQIEFSARFGGLPHDVSLPPSAVLAVYARENGIGMAFKDYDMEGEPPPEPSQGGASRPVLRVVK